jgi:hypothetical protein
MNDDLNIRDAVICHAPYRVPSNIYKLGKACDEWLAKRYASEGRRAAINTWKKADGYKPPAPEREAKTRKLALAIRKYDPKTPKPVKPPKLVKPPKPRVRAKKYASAAERRAAISAALTSVWANMSPEEREARTAKTRRKMDPKWGGVPRHKREAWKKYKREYDRKKRETSSLTPEAVAKRRADARRQYAARDPELRKAQGARRRAKHKAKVAALKALKAAA